MLNAKPKETQKCALPRMSVWNDSLRRCPLDAQQEEYGPKMAQNGPKTAPKMAQDGPQIGQNGP